MYIYIFYIGIEITLFEVNVSVRPCKTSYHHTRVLWVVARSFLMWLLRCYEWLLLQLLGCFDCLLFDKFWV